MSEVLLKSYRGELAENMVRGDLAIVNNRGQLMAFCGNPHKVTYMRSAAKPLQVLVGLDHDIVNYYGLSQQELAILCASHSGEPFHVEAVESILAKIGLSEDDLACGKDYSCNRQIKTRMLAQNLSRRKIFNNCSGKHSLMLAVCRKKGWSIKDYYLPNHPLQQAILSKIAALTEMDKQQIIIGIDGCGVPVFALPLYRMALSYAKLANPQLMPQEAAAIRQVTAAMTAYPQMIAGSGEFCSALMSATGGRILGKKGADGIYCSAVLGGLAVAVKIEDGNMQALPPVMMNIYKQLDILTAAEKKVLTKFTSWDNINCQGEVVGQTIADFTLKAFSSSASK